MLTRKGVLRKGADGMRKRLRLLILIGLLACGDSSGPQSNPTVASVSVTPASAALQTFDSLTLTAVVKDTRGDTLTGRPTNWLSSDTARATVTQTGLVHALRTGPVAILAVVDGVSGQANITVTPSVFTVVVHAGDDSLRPGESLQFTVTLLGKSGNVVTGPTWTWSTSDPTVATVSVTGIAHGRTPGSVSVTATAEGVVGARALRVMVPVELVTITPASVTVGPGVVFPLQVTLRDSTGSQLNGLVVGWASTDTNVATIDTGGRLVGRVPGNTSISATAERRASQAAALIRTVTFTWLGPGDVHTCGVATDQSVFCWGQNGGRLGDSAVLAVDGPVETVGGRSFGQVGSGVDHSCGLLVSGEAYCWGSNRYGQIGQTGVITSTFPVPVQGGLQFRSLSVGQYHTCGLTVDSLAYCWGNGDHGQLGNGGTSSSSVPDPVSGNHRFGLLSAGGAHTCGLTASGAAYCWGANEEGRLGDSTLIARSVPTPVVGGFSFMAISAGGYHTCALNAVGASYCWGDGGSGQIGIDSAAGNNIGPVPVHGGLTFSSITTGLYNTCGVASNGAIYCWGDNSAGESGPNAGPMVSGGRTLAPVPVGINGLTVFAGTWHVCALTQNGAYCWGRDGGWELGDGKTQDSPVPVRVLGQP